MKNEERIGGSSLQKIIESDAFYTTQKTSKGRDFFYFHEYGDYLKGFILSKQSNAHISRSNSFRIKVTEMRRDGKDVAVEDEQVEEFFANYQLQRTIDKNELIGSLVRIVYIGRKKTGFGHSAKIYDVFKDVGVSRRKELRQDGTKRKYAKRKKPGTKPKSGRARARLARSNAARVPASV